MGANYAFATNCSERLALSDEVKRGFGRWTRIFADFFTERLNGAQIVRISILENIFSKSIFFYFLASRPNLGNPKIL